MSVEWIKEGEHEHHCALPRITNLWWATVRCTDCGRYWVAYGGALGRGLRAMWKYVRGAR